MFSNFSGVTIQDNGSGNYTFFIYNTYSGSLTSFYMGYGPTRNNYLYTDSVYTTYTDPVTGLNIILTNLSGVPFRPIHYDLNFVYATGTILDTFGDYQYPQNRTLSQFVLSGNAWNPISGMYYPLVFTFPQNPETMTEVTNNPKNNIFETIQGENIYFRPLLDNQVRQMTWSRAPYSLYSGLNQFAIRTNSGTIPYFYFYDGPAGDFNYTPVQIIDVYGQPLNSQFNFWKIELQFKKFFL